jgi:hypothetical protein
MAHERKASESSSPAKGQKSPIPLGKKDDLEDVSWALSTAEAMWNRGDHADALKWLRRAAESAAEAEADDRALELAKAAADVASLLSGSKPPPVVSPAVPAPPPPPVITTPSKAPPPPPAAARPGAPSPPRVSPPPSLPRPGQQKGPMAPRVAQSAPISKRGGRRSSPSFTDEASGEKAIPSRRASTTNEAKRRRSRPATDEITPLPITAIAKPTETAPWPSQDLRDDDPDDELHTRIGTPAYTESAQKASAPPPAMPVQAAAVPPPPETRRVPPIAAAFMKTSQAVRVVVWRTADGVHVAPAGTTVNAISVEALLVALDPGADLAAWLGNK